MGHQTFDPQYFAFLAGAINSISVSISKSVGLFSEWEYAKRLACQKGFIWSITDLMDVIETYWSRKCALDPEAPSLVIHDFMPRPKHTVHLHSFDIAKLPFPMGACHVWNFRPADAKRRRGMFGTEMRHLTMTGVYARMMRLPDVRNTTANCFHPVMMSQMAPAAEAPDVDADGDDYENTTSIPFEVQMVNGWRCSYRSQAPEENTIADHSTKIARKYDGVSDLIGQLPEGKRHRSTEELVDKARAVADKKNAAARRRAKTMGELYGKDGSTKEA